MISVGAKIIGGDEIINITNKQIKMIKGLVRIVAAELALEVRRKIQESVYDKPNSGLYTRSGKAKQSIHSEAIDSDTYRVYVGVNYGRYIEFGTGIYAGRKAYWTTFGGLLDHAILYRGMPARPFFYPAVKQIKSNIPQIIAREQSKL